MGPLISDPAWPLPRGLFSEGGGRAPVGVLQAERTTSPEESP